MRVELRLGVSPGDEQLEVPWANPASSTHYLDLRETPAGLAEIEPARRYRPLHNLLAAVNSDDSVFSTLRCGAWLNPESGAGPESSEFAARVDLMFAADDLNSDRSHFEGLAQRLLELLTRESGDALHAELCIQPCRFHSPDRSGYALSIRLFAQGETPGQAELRSGLGLARVQQALMFASRVIRHHLALPGA